MQVFFILGNHAELSRAELAAVDKRDGLNMKFSHLSLTVSCAECDRERAIDYKKLIHTVAGIIKVGSVAELVDTLDDIPSIALDFLSGNQGKLFFGISAYDAGGGADFVRKKEKDIGMAVKQLAKSKGISLRFVTSREQTLSSVVVAKNHLLDRGAELVVLVQGTKMLSIGKTEAVQEFAEYGDRDFGRPARDAESGMLPPKLAHSMVNLSECPYNETIFDPFCGSGTVLQEALMLGYTRVVGADQSKKAIVDSQKNSDWLCRKQGIDQENVRIIQSDVRDIHTLELGTIGAVVTEPYLGPPLHGSESEREVNAIYRELDVLYASAIEKIGIILMAGRKMVLILPELLGRTYPWPLFWQAIEVAGFDYTPDTLTPYQREHQHVKRMVCVFTKRIL